MASRQELGTELATGGQVPLRVRFFWAGDRYQHELYLADTCCLRSSLVGIEEWPNSPPLQQLHVEQRTSGDVILAVGMAGKSHWSLSVERAADELVFDYACLVKTPPRFLGSGYERLKEGIELILLDTELNDAQLSQTNARLTIALGDLPEEVISPVTLRWRFKATVAD